MTTHTGKTRKAYAIEQNWCAPGRGRMSKDVLAKIAELEQQGYVFTDSVKYAKVETGGGEKVVKQEFNPHSDTPQPVHFNRQWKVNVDGKVHNISDATVCMHCKVSLPWQIHNPAPVLTKWGEQQAYYDYSETK